MLSCFFPFFDAILIISAIGFSFNYRIITIKRGGKLNANQVQTQLNDRTQHYSHRTLEVTAVVTSNFLFNKCVNYLCQSNWEHCVKRSSMLFNTKENH